MCETRTRVIDVLATMRICGMGAKSHRRDFNTSNSADGRTRTANLSIMSAPL